MAGTLTSGHERTGASFVGATTRYVDKGLLPYIYEVSRRYTSVHVTVQGPRLVNTQTLSKRLAHRYLLSGPTRRQVASLRVQSDQDANLRLAVFGANSHERQRCKHVSACSDEPAWSFTCSSRDWLTTQPRPPDFRA